MKIVPIIHEMKYGGCTVGTVINRQPMIDNFVRTFKSDRRKMSNINVYYEIMNPENCARMGVPYDMLTLNCIDGDELFNQQKQQREAFGYTYSEPTDVTIAGIKCKRIIIAGQRGQDYGEYFGLMSGYAQASHELVCYMVHYDKYIR